LIEKCAAGTNDQGGLFSAGSNALTPTLTGATLPPFLWLLGQAVVMVIFESMPSSPSDTAATLTIAPPTPTQPINTKANINSTDIRNYEQDKLDDTVSPAVVESLLIIFSRPV
jgi:hypothetical protein